MFEQVVVIFAILSAVGTGLIGGVFFAFSNFVMQALARIESRAGMSAMQQINIVVINPLFMLVFLGSAGTSGVAIVLALLRWHERGSAWLVVAGTLYIVGSFGVTMVCNVPLNNRLAKLDPSDPHSESTWRDYVVRWTRFNSVRAVASLLACAAYVLAIAR